MKVKALRNCLFSHEGKAYRVVKGEELELDVSKKLLDPRSFVILESEPKPKKKKQEREVEE